MLLSFFAINFKRLVTRSSFVWREISISSSINFNNLYLQIPFIVNTRIDNATFAEAGFFITSALANNSTQDLSTTIFSEFTNNGQFITNSPPRVVGFSGAKPFPAFRPGTTSRQFTADSRQTV